MSEFFHQGGYAFFVWGAYGMTFLLLAAEIIALVINRRTIRSQVSRWARGADPLAPEAGEQPPSVHQ